MKLEIPGWCTPLHLPQAAFDIMRTALSKKLKDAPYGDQFTWSTGQVHSNLIIFISAYIHKKFCLISQG